MVNENDTLEFQVEAGGALVTDEELKAALDGAVSRIAKGDGTEELPECVDRIDVEIGHRPFYTHVLVGRKLLPTTSVTIESSGPGRPELVLRIPMTSRVAVKLVQDHVTTRVDD